MEMICRYRLPALGGATAITALAVVVANHPVSQTLVTSLRRLQGPESRMYTNGHLVDETLMTLTIVLAVLWPLFKPRLRRILDTISLTERRVFLGATALATVGYFDWSSRLPQTTLILTAGVLALALPAWFLYIRRTQNSHSRAVIVGDSRSAMEQLQRKANVPVLGYVAPMAVEPAEDSAVTVRVADGGATTETLSSLPRLSGLSTLEEALVEYVVNTVLVGFDHSDREEFFGTLATCHEQGVHAMVHRDVADGILVADATGAALVNTDLEPWDLQDYVLKRAFDVAFAAAGLLVLLPLVALIAVAVKLDSPGPVLNTQRRTAEFGETFSIYKFRSMVPDAESNNGATLGDEDADKVDPRVTRVGRVLRLTHLNEIPQSWSVLVGDMSVVGPRPERPELDADTESSVDQWRSRWFDKPGLTGLAQINGVTGHDRDRTAYGVTL